MTSKVNGNMGNECRCGRILSSGSPMCGISGRLGHASFFTSNPNVRIICDKFAHILIALFFLFY